MKTLVGTTGAIAIALFLAAPAASAAGISLEPAQPDVVAPITSVYQAGSTDGTTAVQSGSAQPQTDIGTGSGLGKTQLGFGLSA
ncbi:MAG: hypothetical protein JWN03_2710 [Nocardia sp.]|uniref:hypothetical protein n=1 Tax=Nocardia sp. TaxID=1821 RepID=UPI0026215926|nr:hypothetical protein [Nocardia sp.]MCU1642435.1 hypothetical protein [Nocardia sp.]